MRDHEYMQNLILETPYGKDHSKDIDAFEKTILRDIWGSHAGDNKKETLCLIGSDVSDESVTMLKIQAEHF